MLIVPSLDHLTDKRLNKHEALEKIRERKRQDLKRFELPNQDELTNFVARMGKPLAFNEFVERVKKMTNYRLWAEESMFWGGGMNFYMMKNGQKVCCNTPFLKGYLPEHTVIHPDENNHPASKTPGWREVLMRLIQQKIITKSQAKKFFGDPTVASTRWDQFSRNYI